MALEITKVEKDNAEMLKFLIIIITFEHIVVVIKFLIENYIPDTP